MEKTYRYIWIVLFALIAIAHVVSKSLGLYHKYFIFDIILHVIGGMALGFLWLWLIGNTSWRSQYLKYLSVLMAAVFGSFIWELWELGGSVLIPSLADAYQKTFSDTMGDISCGLAGGFIAILISKFLPSR